jgi:Hypothetical protein (DUF2513)
VKRDMDLCRQILLYVEGRVSDGWHHGLQDLQLLNPDEAIVYYQVKLLHEAGLLEVHHISTSEGDRWLPISLTWAGHEFLDAARDEKRWGQAKKMSEQVGGVALDVMKGLLQKLASQALGLPG